MEILTGVMASFVCDYFHSTVSSGAKEFIGVDLLHSLQRMVLQILLYQFELHLEVGGAKIDTWLVGSRMR